VRGLKYNNFIAALLGGAGIPAFTFNPARTDASVALSNGNLTAVGSVGAFRNSFGIKSQASGLFYCEITVNALNGTDGIGIANNNLSTTQNPGGDTGSIGYFGNGGSVIITGVGRATLASFATGSVVSMAVDIGNKKIWFRVGGGGWNNDILANQNPATNTGGVSWNGLIASGPFTPVVCVASSGSSFTANFGATSYLYSVPSGFLNWK
jgi:hypothetical protein